MDSMDHDRILEVAVSVRYRLAEVVRQIKTVLDLSEPDRTYGCEEYYDWKAVIME